jgi:CheY-like chemotaxis protein
MGKRILVADDSRTIQQAFAMVMDGSGYTLSFARSVDEALAVAKRDGRPDLVLSDAALGTGSGYDLCAQLKSDSALHDVPVFILASLQTPYDDARGRKVGADGHLAKPFESQALLDAVASALTTPARRPSAAMGAVSQDGAAGGQFGDAAGAEEDDDSYGEITIERGPASAPSPAAWAARPPTRPSGARPLPAAPTPAAAAQPMPRAPMIPGPRPPTPAPAVRATLPQPAVGLPPPPSPQPARQPARTMMGFPSAKGVPTSRPPTAVVAPAVSAPIAPTPSRPATVPPATFMPARAPAFPTPTAPAAPVPSRPLPAAPSLPSPLMGGVPRPVPAMPSRPATVPPATGFPPAPVVTQAPPQPTTRRVTTPMPASELLPSSPAAAAVVASAIDQKVAAIAARGPEFEAIAKLSREIIEQVVWEVVPELAETIIRQEVDRLASARK